MRLLGELCAAAAAFLLLAAAAIYGANFFLRNDGGEIAAFVRTHFPGAEVGFRSARFRLNWGGVGLRADDLSASVGGSSLHAPRADFWFGPGGAVVVLDSPTVSIRRGGGGGGGFLPGGGWALSAKNAALNYSEGGGKATVSLTQTDVQITGEDGIWRAEAQKSGALRASAEARLQNGELKGAGYAEFAELPAGILPAGWQTDATVRAEFSGGKISLVVGGKLRAEKSEIRWRGAGEFAEGELSATVAAAAPRLRPPFFADAPSAAAYALGPLRYESKSGKWQWLGRVVAGGEDGALEADIDARGGGGRAAAADISARVFGLPARSVRRYTPNAGLREWFDESVSAGVFRRADAKMRLRGKPARAEIVGLTAFFSGGKIRIAEEWPDAEKLNGVLMWDGKEIFIGGDGQIAGAAARNISVRILGEESGPVLRLDAQFYRAPVKEYLAAARAIPPFRAEIESFARTAELSGGARLSLFISAPFSAPEDSDFHIRLSPAGDGAVRVGDFPPFLRASGEAEIDRGGVRAVLRGMFAGHPATVFANHGGAIKLRGRISTALVSDAAGFDFPAEGAANFELRRTEQQTVFLSDLRGVAIAMPPPLAKTAEEEGELLVRSDSSGIYGELRLAGNVFRAATAEGKGTDIAINVLPVPPPPEGVYIRGKIGGVEDAGAWTSGGGGGGGGAAFAGVSLLITNSYLFNAFYGTLSVRSPPPQNGGRTIVLGGDGAAGTVFYGGGVFRADLSRFSIGGGGNGTAMDGGADIRDLIVSVAVADLRFGDSTLGSLRIDGAPSGGGGWVLRGLSVQNGANILRAAGAYDGAQTSITVSLSAPDVPALLSSFGQGGVISEGGAEIRGNLFWPETPVDFSVEKTGGGVSLSAEDVRYTSDGGGGVVSFLAVFSPESLLQLGFTEIGREGVRLDTLEGAVGFSGGEAEFRNFSMVNEDVFISLGGAADLQTRTLNLNGRVRPGKRVLRAGNVVSIGAGLTAVQPLSIAAGWFLGKIFEKPISEIGAYNYTITGPWESPVYAETGVTYTEPPTPAP